MIPAVTKDGLASPVFPSSVSARLVDGQTAIWSLAFSGLLGLLVSPLGPWEVAHDLFSVARSGPRRSLKDGVHETSNLRILIACTVVHTYHHYFHIYIRYTNLHRHADLSPASTQSIPFPSVVERKKGRKDEDQITQKKKKKKPIIIQYRSGHCVPDNPSWEWSLDRLG